MATLDSETDGGSGSTTDGGADDGGDGAPENGLSWDVLKGILSRVGLERFFAVFLGAGAAAVIAGENGLLVNPRGFIVDVVIDWLFNSFLLPIAQSLWDGGVAVIDALTILFYGTDYAIGIREGSGVGMLDFPFLLTDPAGDAVLSIGDALSDGVETLNAPVVDAMAGLGIVAPFVGSALITLELAAVLWLLWVIINAVDIPVVRVVPILRTAMSPFTRLVRWLIT